MIALNPYTCTMSEVSVTPVLCTMEQNLTSRWQNGELSQIYLVLKAACSATPSQLRYLTHRREKRKKYIVIIYFCIIKVAIS